MDDMRIGFGYDSHRFEAGRRLVLGGVEIPDETGLRGHSDADALLHAVIDALLGAAALGDIGSHFPDTDERWTDADSAQLLARVVDEVEHAGWTIGNIDITVICERVRIRPHVEAIRARLADLLWPHENELDVADRIARVSVKGKTNEKMDDVGAGVGIEVHAVCLLRGKAR